MSARTRSNVTPAPATTDAATPATDTPAPFDPAPVAAALRNGDSAAYVDGDRKARAAVRSFVAERVSASVAAFAAAFDAGDMPAATAANAERKAWDDAAALASASGAARPAAAAVDFVAATAVRIDALRFAADALATGAVRIDGDSTPFDADALAVALSNVTLSDDEKALSLAVAGRRITRSGPTNKVGDGIADALADDAPGTFVPLSVIGKRWEKAGGPAASVSGGRIAARVFAKSGCTVPGIEPADSIPGTRPRGVIVRDADYVHAATLSDNGDDA